MYKCKHCGKEFDSKYKLAGHSTHCIFNPNFSKEKIRSNLEKARSQKQNIGIKDDTEYECKFCGKLCKGKNSLKNHEIRCKYNPNRINIQSNFIKYNNDIKTGKIIKEYKNHYDKANKLGSEKPIMSNETKNKISKVQTGKIISDDIRKKISKTQKDNYRGKSRWYTQTQHRLSYAEQYFYDIFVNCKKHYHVDRYFLDIAYPEYKVYIEVDGEQHKKDPKVVEHDIERTNNLQNIGWILIERIYWPDYVKMNSADKISYVNTLISKLNKFGITNI